MVEKRLEVKQKEEHVFAEIMELINSKRNFLLSGGAGSGKTYSLVQVIKEVINKYPLSKVACMTYTNAAVKEIEERVNHKNLNVSTIHDFLWDSIKHFQKEIKKVLIDLVNDEEVKKIKITNETSIPNNYFENREETLKIQYKEYVRIKDGIISHDELLLIADKLFEKYPKLSDIVKDKYPFIFIDEYQDTHPEVVRILLEHFKKSRKQSIIGFFGDEMQSIYDDGIGNINSYKGDAENQVHEVKKLQNRRNPQSVIELANRLRTDGIKQEASGDFSAPNMLDGQIKQGQILFLHSKDKDLTKVRKLLIDEYGWNFDDTKETKELNLTHNLIADKAGFKELMNIYDKDPILGLVTQIKSKIKREKLAVDSFDEKTFDEVVDIIQPKNKKKELKKDIILSDENNKKLYFNIKDRPFQEVRKIYVDKDQLIDDKKQDVDDENKKGSKRDYLIQHLYKIEKIISLYKNKKYHDFLQLADYKNIVSIEDKRILKNNIEALIDTGDKTIEQIINEADEYEICKIDDNLEHFRTQNDYLYNRVKNVKYRVFRNLFIYLEGFTPFSTQHKIKGAEFNNVLVLLDNGKWNKYNFDYLFLNKAKSESVLNRTKKIFYVCCTRAKENLAVFYDNPSDFVLEKAKEWFGKENMKEIK